MAPSPFIGVKVAATRPVSSGVTASVIGDTHSYTDHDDPPPESENHSTPHFEQNFIDPLSGCGHLRRPTHAWQTGQRFSLKLCPKSNITLRRSVPTQRNCTISVVALSLDGSRMTKMIITIRATKLTEMMRHRTRKFSRHFSANWCFWSSLSCAFKPLPSARCQSVARASRHGWRWWAVPAQLG